VLPVGGIKEKVLAAHRAGIQTVILPAWNRKDLEDIPKNVQKEIRFRFVDRMMDAVDLALEEGRSRARRSKRRAPGARRKT
jgi:ATP-dependent Lon protease